MPTTTQPDPQLPRRRSPRSPLPARLPRPRRHALPAGAYAVAVAAFIVTHIVVGVSAPPTGDVERTESDSVPQMPVLRHGRGWVLVGGELGE